MLTTAITAFKSKWQRLTIYSGSRRLSWFAVILVFALDAYVLSLLFDGAKDAQQMVDTPYPHISRLCMNMSIGFLQEDTKEQIQSIARFAERVHENKEAAISEFNYFEVGLLPICAQIREKLIATVSDATLLSLFAKRKQEREEMEKIESNIKELKASYSDALLEKLARQKRSESILPVEASKIKWTTTEMETALTELRKNSEETQSELEHHPLILVYVAYLNALPLDSEFGKENTRYERLAFWYPLKVLAAQAGFIVPPLLLVIFWNARSIRKQQDTKILISSHLILVCAVPIFIRILFLIRDLLPNELLQWVLQTLHQWKLSFIWYYLVIFAGIAGGLLLTFVAQRTFFTAARQRVTRLRKAQCQQCGEKLRSSEQDWCEMCGAEQSAHCGNCGKKHRLLAFHCSHCGTALTATAFATNSEPSP